MGRSSDDPVIGVERIATVHGKKSAVCFVDSGTLPRMVERCLVCK